MFCSRNFLEELTKIIRIPPVRQNIMYLCIMLYFKNVTSCLSENYCQEIAQTVYRMTCRQSSPTA
jgi:glycogen synthase